MRSVNRPERNIHITATVLLAMLLSALGFFTVCGDVPAGAVGYRTSDTGRVALECILAWDSVHTDRILEILRENDARITFVISGETALSDPLLVRRIAAAGHSLYTCGMRYDDAASLDEDGLVQSISRSCEVLRGLGVTAEGFYCMTGDTQKAAGAARRLGIHCVRCTVDLMCGRGSADDVRQRAALAAHGGNIVAFTPTQALCDALPDILRTVRSRCLSVTGI